MSVGSFVMESNFEQIANIRGARSEFRRTSIQTVLVKRSYEKTFPGKKNDIMLIKSTLSTVAQKPMMNGMKNPFVLIVRKNSPLTKPTIVRRSELRPSGELLRQSSSRPDAKPSV